MTYKHSHNRNNNHQSSLVSGEAQLNNNNS